MSTIREIVRKIPVEEIVGLDFDLTQSGQRYLRGIEHDSLVIDKHTNTFHWNSLDVHGTALDWLLKIKGMSMDAAVSLLQDFTGAPLRHNFESLFRPSYPYYKLTEAFWKRGRTLREYWYARGYTDGTIDKFKLGHTGRHYVIPIIHGDTLVNFQCIAPQTSYSNKRVWHWTRGLGKQPFNFSTLPNNDWVIITESPVDAIIADQYGFPAISLLPNALNWERHFNHYLANIKKIYLTFDNDIAGKRGLRKVGKHFAGRVRVIDWDGYPEKTDVGDVLLMENGVENLQWLLRDSLPYDALKSETSWEFYKYLQGRVQDERKG